MSDRMQEYGNLKASAEATAHLVVLARLLSERDRDTVLAVLKKEGYLSQDSLTQASLEDLHNYIRSLLPVLFDAAGTAPEVRRRVLTGDQNGSSLIRVREGQEHTHSTALAIVDYPGNLEGPQIEWVRERLIAGYERARFLNTPLIQSNDFPPFPSLDEVYAAVLKQLTTEQMTYMMREDAPKWSFTVKFKPNKPGKTRLEVARMLLNKKRNRVMGEEDLEITKSVEADFASLEPIEEKPTILESVIKHTLQAIRRITGKAATTVGGEWWFAFIEADQIPGPKELTEFAGLVERQDLTEGQRARLEELANMSKLQDDLEGSIKQRELKRRSQRPSGVHGMDLESWVLLLADGLESGRPPDLRFENDRTDLPVNKCSGYSITVLEEEDELLAPDTVETKLLPASECSGHSYTILGEDERSTPEILIIAAEENAAKVPYTITSNFGRFDYRGPIIGMARSDIPCVDARFRDVIDGPIADARSQNPRTPWRAPLREMSRRPVISHEESATVKMTGDKDREQFERTQIAEGKRLEGLKRAHRYSANSLNAGR